jgi:hypothetical protein
MQPQPLSTPAHSHRLVACGLAAALSVPLPVLALDLPRAGVVCDRKQQICYDARGASLDQTRREFGREAERDLLRSLSGRPPARAIEFSSGEVCDLSERRCWDDGWKRRNVSTRLTRQLFSGSGGSWDNANRGDARCRLSQRGRRLFDGGCNLFGRGGSYVVETQDGRRYSFVNENGRLVLRDATGRWPVSAWNSGGMSVFRWADVELQATRRSDWSSSGGGYGGGGYGGGGYGRQAPAEASGASLQQLLNGLFGTN